MMDGLLNALGGSQRLRKTVATVVKDMAEGKRRAANRRADEACQYSA
jgi:hypothetical protein